MNIKTLFSAAAALAVCLSAGAADLSQQLGIQTWTLRNMKFEQVVEFATKHGIKNLQMIGNHMDPKAPLEETKRKKAVLDAAGLKVYTFGVAGTSLDKEDNRKLFEFAKFMGIKVIVVEPSDYKIFDNLEELVKEYDIKIAIHNHGIRSLYGNPAVVRALLKHRDPRMGVCMDAGWITSTGMDPTKVFQEYNGRVYDIHLKDKKVEKTQGDDVSFDTHIGKGQGKLENLMAELKKVNWPGVLAIETDSNDFARDPNEFVAGAKAFVEQHGK
ncbi:MAG: sugar phosphate isomerase/epimerase [Verrucomicrobiales bacterium]|nr:sugar phosphate isomerase/epimerase [Verrucomicrobiales bacterium]